MFRACQVIQLFSVVSYVVGRLYKCLLTYLLTYLITYLLTLTGARVLLEKLTSSQKCDFRLVINETWSSLQGRSWSDRGFYVRGTVHRNSVSINVQQGATIHSLFYL